MDLASQATPLLKQRLIINENRRKLKKCLFWGATNLCLLGIVLYDIMHTCPVNIIWCVLYFEYALSVVFFSNVAYHFVRYINISLNTAPIVVTPEQKRLLGIKDYDPTYTLADSPCSSMLPSVENTPNTSLSNTPMNLSALSWRSNMTSFNDSQNYSPSALFSCVRSSPQHSYDHQSPANVSPLNVNRRDTSGGEFINDEQSLTDYLKGYQTYENAANLNSPAEQSISLLSSFWNHPAAKNNGEAPSFLRKCQYQLSPLTMSSSSSSPSGKSDDKGSPANIHPQGMEMWRRLQVDSVTLTQWNANIRMWISQTIVERLVKEIEYIDDTLQKQGLSDVRVGGVGLDRLRKTAQMTPVLQFIPTLSALIPFLEVSSNQEYLVKRIRELAKGGCMSNFKWNGGSSFDGKEWNDSLPTDSAIIMHLFATYMDTQLLPLPNRPDVKPFSGNHYIKCTDKMPTLSYTTLAIHQVTEKPPHYRVIIGEEIFEMVKGYNNLFHSILLFIYQFQGVDMSSIMENLMLAKPGDTNVVISAITALSNLAKIKPPPKSEEFQEKLAVIKSECDKGLGYRVFAGKEGAYNVIIDVMLNNETNAEVTKDCLKALTSLMTTQPDLLDDTGVKTIIAYLDKQEEPEIQTLLLKWLKECCVMHEMNRQRLFEAAILDHLKPLLENGNAATLRDVLAVLQALLLDDDVRVEFSRSHEHASAIASGTLCQIIALLSKYKTEEALMSDVMLTLSAVVVRNELCKKVEDAGGLDMIKDMMITFYDKDKLTRQCFKFLKVLAGNDEVKARIIQKELAPIIASSLNRHKDSAQTVTTGLGCIAALTLRSSDNSKSMFEAGAPEVIVESMKLHLDNVNVQKNGSWAIRNMVSRSRYQTQKFLDLGIEEILLKDLQKFKNYEYDIKTALRDLGCKVDLKEE